MDSHLWPRLLLLSWGLVAAAGEAVRTHPEARGMLYLRSPDTATASGIPIAVWAKTASGHADHNRKLAIVLEQYFLEQPGYYTINVEMWSRLSAWPGEPDRHSGCSVQLDAAAEGGMMVRAACAFPDTPEELLGECGRDDGECIREIVDSVVKLIWQRTNT